MEEWVRKLRKLCVDDYINKSAESVAQKIKQPHIPRSLFKYRAYSANALDNLEKDTLWSAHPNAFNDPYDCSLHFEIEGFDRLIVNSILELGLLGEDEIAAVEASSDPLTFAVDRLKEKFPEQKGLSQSGFLNSLLDEMHAPRDLLVKQLKDSVSICSLCERIDSLLMWGHYGSNHEGFAMEYDFSAGAVNKDLKDSLWPVVYENKVYSVQNVIFGKKAREFNQLFKVGAVTTKCLDWSYEKEWRLISRNPEASNGSLVSVPKPVAIYLGSNMKDEPQSEIIRLATIKKVPVFKMKLARGQFKMEPVKL